jgi:hypothetical protein
MATSGRNNSRRGPGGAARGLQPWGAVGDLDNDGDLDVLVMNMDEPSNLLRNDLKSSGNWLKVKLIGTKSNRSAIVSRVTAQYGDHRQAQDVTAQSSFDSVNNRRLHFGLGSNRTASLTERRTNDETEIFDDVPANQLVVIEVGVDIIRSIRMDGTKTQPV